MRVYCICARTLIDEPGGPNASQIAWCAAPSAMTGLSIEWRQPVGSAGVKSSWHSRSSTPHPSAFPPGELGDVSDEAEQAASPKARSERMGGHRATAGPA
jgi:hypothetical protein